MAYAADTATRRFAARLERRSGDGHGASPTSGGLAATRRDGDAPRPAGASARGQRRLRLSETDDLAVESAETGAGRSPQRHRVRCLDHLAQRTVAIAGNLKG